MVIGWSKNDRDSTTVLSAMDPQDMGDGGEMPPTNEGASPNPENEAEPRWDEDSYEDPTQMIMEIGDLPQMERVQEALYQQLMRDHERVALELREKGEELKRAKQRREDTGVELYGVQTQLAKLQMAVETSHNQKNLIAEYRGKSEEDLESVRADFKISKDELVDNKKQLYKNQAELDALSATLRQVELYNQEMKSEIAVTRRATYKAEEKLGNMEKDKTSQDLYIDTLNENLKELHNRLALLEAQLGSQKNETQVLPAVSCVTAVLTTCCMCVRMCVQNAVGAEIVGGAVHVTPSPTLLSLPPSHARTLLLLSRDRLRTKPFVRLAKRWRVCCSRRNSWCSSGRAL